MNLLTFSLEKKNEFPLYQQLYLQIKKEIVEGRILPGERIPSKRKLSAYLELGQNTVQAAYDQLLDEGYILAEERRGYFVAKLDNIIRLEENSLPIVRRKEEKRIRYDFSYQGVDRDSFPYALWRRLHKEVIEEGDGEITELGEAQGNYALRIEIARYLHGSRGVNCLPEQIIISAGTEYLLQTLIHILPQHTLYGLENPGYERLNQIFSRLNAEHLPLELDAEGLAIDALQKSSVDVALITPSHQFPTGRIMPVSRRIELLNWAKEKGERYIIEDDYDSEFKYGGRPIPALQGLDGGEKVVYLGAFSKSLAPGIRTSYMVLPPNLLRIYNSLMKHLACPVATLNQKVLTRFISEGHFERHLNKMRNLYKRKREILVRELKKLGKRYEIIGAEAGLHLVIRIKDELTERELITRAEKNDVRVYGLSSYYYGGHDSEKHPRILLGFASMKEEEIVEAVKRLEKAWRERETW